MLTLRPEEIKQVQFAGLEMLREADRICRLRGIPYVIIAGTLLGAVRHGGFIPWDDDVDIGLLRPDYERFREACKTDLDTSRFVFQDDRAARGYRWGYGKLRRLGTLFVREHQEKMPYFQGIFLDVFPLDEVPAFYPARLLWSAECFVIRKLLWSKVGKTADGRPFARLLYSMMDLIPEKKVRERYHALIRRSLRLAERNEKRGGKERYVRILLFPAPAPALAYKRNWYAARKQYIFEGESYPGIGDAAEYLSFKYGKYEELPGEPERRAHPVSRFALPAGRPCAVFGTGHVAGVFAKALALRGREDDIRVYVTSSGGDGKTFRGKPVVSAGTYARMAADAKDGMPLLLAVHESALGEVRAYLADHGVSGTWIAPSLPALLYGSPLRERTDLTPAKILAASPRDHFWIDARYGALRYFYEGNECGASVYRKAIAAFSSAGTAERRLAHFRKLCLSVEKNGLDPERPVLLDEDLRIIDGVHRLALAVYLGEERIPCRIFRRSRIYGEVMNDRVFFREACFDEVSLSAEEKAFLLETRKILYRGII